MSARNDRLPHPNDLFAVEAREKFDRALGRPALAAIGISGTIGIGIFITSGQHISTAGSLGTFFAYVVASSIAAAVLYTLSELVACRPVMGALIDYANTFVSDELGYAVGYTYYLAECVSMATLNSATARVADSFSENGLDSGSRAALIIVLVIITAASNLIGVRKYGKLERIVGIFKLILMIFLVIICIIVLSGVAGARNAGPQNQGLHLHWYSNLTMDAFPPAFRPDGYRNLTEWNSDTHDGKLADAYGISGGGGRLFALFTAITWAMFSCMGGDQVIMTAGEAKDPWNDLPVVTKFIYLIPLTAYPILALLVGLTVNYADPHLYKPWAVQNLTKSHSPFIIAVTYSSLTALPNILNACFLLSAYTCANTSLYVSSRTLFYVSQEYGPPWARKFFAKTSEGHTPRRAIAFSSIFGFLGLLGLADKTFDQPILTLSAFFTGAVGCVYISECYAFLQFRKGLNSLHKRRVFSRSHPLYKKYLFNDALQPYIAYFGMIGTGAVVIFSGIPSIWLLVRRKHLAEKDNIKSAGLIAADLVGAYSGPVIFILVYYYRKFTYPSTPRNPEQFTVDMYVIPDEALFENSARARRDGVVPVRVAGDGTDRHNPTEKKIEEHLRGHGKVFTEDRKGRERKGRGFWTEASMFIVERQFEERDTLELGVMRANGGDGTVAAGGLSSVASDGCG